VEKLTGNSLLRRKIQTKTNNSVDQEESLILDGGCELFRITSY